MATLKHEPAEISKRLGLKFETVHDDLDELEAAVIVGTDSSELFRRE